MYLACNCSRVDILDFILLSKPNLDVQGRDGRTALTNAARYDYKRIVQILLDAGADPAHRDGGGRSIRHYAAMSFSRAVWDLIIDRLELGNVEERTSDGNILLLCAAYGENLEKIEHLLSKGADINAKNYAGNSLMHIACSLGKAATVNYILQGYPQFDIDAPNEQGQTPLSLAVAGSHYDIFTKLVAAGASKAFVDDTGKTLLHHLALRGGWQLVNFDDDQVLHDIGSDLEARDNTGMTALLLASSNGHRLLLSKLIGLGANSEATDTDGWGALHHAAQNIHYDVAHYLLVSGTIKDANYQNPRIGQTVLNVAVLRGHLTIVETLLDHGADPTHTDNVDWNAFHYAAYHKKQIILRRLLKPGKTASLDQSSALKPDVKKMVVARAAVDVNARTASGFTALMLAHHDKSTVVLAPSIAEVLRAHGARDIEPPGESWMHVFGKGDQIFEGREVVGGVCVAVG